MLGSPRRLDGNGATWEPCEPLMNIFREKVIAKLAKIMLLAHLSISHALTIFHATVSPRLILLLRLARSNSGKSMGENSEQVTLSN